MNILCGLKNVFKNQILRLIGKWKNANGSRLSKVIYHPLNTGMHSCDEPQILTRFSTQ